MSTQVARLQPIMLLPLRYPESAKTNAYQPAPGLTIARGTILGAVTTGVADVDTVTLNNSPTGGTFTVSVANSAGAYISAPIAYNATTAAVQAALQAMPNVGNGNVTVTGTAGASYVLTAASNFLGGTIGTVTASGASLTGAGAQPTATVAHTTTDLPLGSVKAYASGNTDGSQIPLGPSMYDFTTDANGAISLGTGTSFGIALGHEQTIPIYISGWFSVAELTGLDNNAVTALFARTFAETSPGGAFTSVRIP